MIQYIEFKKGSAMKVRPERLKAWGDHEGVLMCERAAAELVGGGKGWVHLGDRTIQAKWQR